MHVFLQKIWLYIFIMYIYHIQIALPRMRRYFAKHTKAGEPVATKEAMNLWKTDEGRAWDHSKPSNTWSKQLVSAIFYINMTRFQLQGQKLREAFLKHGTFSAVECEVAKWHRASLDMGKRGMWCTRSYLTTDKHWTKYLVWVWVLRTFYVIVCATCSIYRYKLLCGLQ